MKKKLAVVLVSVIMLLAGNLFTTNLCMATMNDGEEKEGKKENQVQNTGESAAEKAVWPENLNNQGYDVVFCIDNSGSVWHQQAIRDEALRSISNLAVGSDIRIGGVYFADSIYKKLALTSMEEKEGSMQVLQDFLNLTEQNVNNRDTNIGKALETAWGLFENQDESRQKIIILFSDGINENMAGESEYKKAADALTKRQTTLLKEAGIPLYCVYLQKDRNDEQYLKSLVNYFDEENSYDAERFKKVTDAEINTLSEQFAQIFYAMQNNMKYRNIIIDSSGRTSFYVPSLGVRKLQIYLKNDKSYRAVLSCEKDERESKTDSWQDGSSAYISVENPAIGEWILDVNGDNVESTVGTIAYYADLSAYVELIPEKGKSNEIYKNSNVKAKAVFFDNTGKEVKLDSAASVSADVILTNLNGEEMSQKISMKSSDKGCISDSFKIEDYGSYRFQLNVVYEDFVNLNYSMNGGDIEGKAPETFDQSGTFSAMKTKKGEKFTFKSSELYKDPENEKVVIKKVVQLNEKNPVTVTEKDGIITAIAKKTGNVKFAVNLEDSTGLKSVVTIEGKIQDKITMSLIKTGIILVVLGVIILIFTNCQKKKSLQRRVKCEKDKFIRSCEVIENIYVKFMDAAKHFNREIYEDAFRTLQSICQTELLEEQWEDFGVQEYMRDGYVNQNLLSLDTAARKLAERKARIEEPNLTVQRMKIDTDKKELRKMFLQLVQYETDAEESIKLMKTELRRYLDSVEKLEEDIEDISEKYCEIAAMLETPITCNLMVDWRDYTGSKVCKKGKKYLEGYYSLDESVKLLGPEGVTSFKELFKRNLTGLLVYGYNEDGKEGLRLYSRTSFRFKLISQGAEAARVNEAVLLRGESYCLTVDEIGMIIIRVE